MILYLYIYEEKTHIIYNIIYIYMRRNHILYIYIFVGETNCTYSITSYTDHRYGMIWVLDHLQVLFYAPPGCCYWNLTNK